MGFDEADRARVHAGSGQRVVHGGSHTLLAGSQIANLARAIVVDGRALDDRKNVVSVPDCFVQAFQQHHAGSVAEDGALGTGIEARQ